jgi:hypothetical protein
MIVWCHATCWFYTFLTKRKSSSNIDGVRIVRWQNALIHIVSSSGMTYAIVVSVPVEEHNIHMTYITTYPPNGTHAFNAAWTTQHTLRELIHILRKRSQDIPRFTHHSCMVVTSRTTDTHPLPRDRVWPKASLILRRRVRDSHHPVRGYLHSYLFIGVALQNSKLHIVNTESKS